MSAMASQITCVSSVCSTICSGADQRKHQSFASLVLVREIHPSPMHYPHKGPATKWFHCHIFFFVNPDHIWTNSPVAGDLRHYELESALNMAVAQTWLVVWRQTFCNLYVDSRCQGRSRMILHNACLSVTLKRYSNIVFPFYNRFVLWLLYVLFVFAAINGCIDWLIDWLINWLIERLIERASEWVSYESLSNPSM